MTYFRKINNGNRIQKHKTLFINIKPYSNINDRTSEHYYIYTNIAVCCILMVKCRKRVYWSLFIFKNVLEHMFKNKNRFENFINSGEFFCLSFFIVKNCVHFSLSLKCFIFHRLLFFIIKNRSSSKIFSSKNFITEKIS